MLKCVYKWFNGFQERQENIANTSCNGRLSTAHTAENIQTGKGAFDQGLLFETTNDGMGTRQQLCPKLSTSL